jgi:uncharacterized BrkB/YihY/UPF0761 family membrane protein
MTQPRPASGTARGARRWGSLAAAAGTRQRRQRRPALVANLAYSCFISLFPLLLVLVTIVGLVAASDLAFRTAVHDAVASQFPLIGQQLTGNVHQLWRSSVAANVGMYVVAFRVLTPKAVPGRILLPGAVAGAVAWTLLQVLGTYLVHHFENSGSVYGVFAIVLGLAGWIYLGAEVTVYAAEINVVLARKLWPRAIVQPPLTAPDRASMALQELQNQRCPNSG